MAKPIPNNAQGQNPAEPRNESNVKIEFSKELLTELQNNIFSGRCEENVIGHIGKVLEILDLVKIGGVDPFQLRMKAFPLSFKGRKRMVDERGKWKYFHLGRVSEEILSPIIIGNEEELLNDEVSSDKEWEEQEYGNPPKDSFLKPYFEIVDKFEVIKYTIRDNEEFLAICTRECDSWEQTVNGVSTNLLQVKMDDPNITIKEYIRLEEEKARRRAIVFNDTSEATLSCEPTVSSLNDNKIDFRISFNESDDEDYTIIFDKNSFSHKIISVNNLKTDSENDNDKVNMHLLPSPEPTVSYFDDLDFFKDFENEFPAIVYNDAQTSKSDLLTEPILNPQHIDEFNLKDETSLSECDEEEQNVLNFNDLFPFNVLYLDDLKLDKDNDDDKIDIKQSSRGFKRFSSSSSSSQNMAFVSSPSSTNGVNTAYRVSTTNTQVSPAITQVSTASTQVSTANLSDDTVYAFLSSQPNGSQLVYKDLEQIHEDDIEEMDLINPVAA
ncbi:hypothetical protein Tco_0091780 [Tanacetum coccineum]